MKIIKIIKKILNCPDFLKSNLSFAQEGEDLILLDLLNNPTSGFYVDVGAFDPVRFSNTKIFYDRGWRGINIEPTLDKIKKFNKKRPNDINISCGIAKNQEERVFYRLNEPALNTFNKDNVKKYEAAGYKLIDQKLLPIKPLQMILDDCKVGKISFMSIDVEGLEMEVLASNNWTKYRPKVVLVEVHEKLEDILESEIFKFMKSQNYSLVAKTVRTAFFKLSV